MPPSSPAHQVTQLLVRWRSGDQGALDDALARLPEIAPRKASSSSFVSSAG